jgi:hypothetical protein
MNLYDLQLGDQQFTTTFVKRSGSTSWSLNNNDDKIKEMFAALIENGKSSLQEVTVCPLCERKVNTKAQKYQPTREMVDILFLMHRVMSEDPKQRGYVRMVERPERARDDERTICTANGIKQNHKMRMLDLISYVDVNHKPCLAGAKRILGGYTLTQRGKELLMGLPITPWQIHVKNKKAVLLDEDRQTSGSITDVKDLTYDEWVEMAKVAKVPLKIPS